MFVERVVALVDAALADGLGSAAAVSIGDAGVEVERFVRGTVRRLPDVGPAIDDSAWFDLASLTKPIATVAIAMVLVAENILDLDAPVRRFLKKASTTGSVRELLGHAAGCTAHVEFFRKMKLGSANPRGELVDLATAEPTAPPGVHAVYSDLGYIQLGALLERAYGTPLEQAFSELVAAPLGLGARYSGIGPLPAGEPSASPPARPSPARLSPPIAGAVATEIDDRGVVCGYVHDENAYYGGGACGHAGLFARIRDVATFAAAIVETAAGDAHGRFRTDVVNRFFTERAARGASWRLGWDTPSATPGVSHAGDRWPRTGSVGHLGFTGTSLWIDLPHRRWVAMLTNRVHPTRQGTADAIKALRRAVNDAVIDALG
jgi:CubicO group peptidase (beta-lactamase class C family)